MKKIALLSLLLAMPTAQAAAPLPCSPLPGAEALTARADLDFLILGEAHGTAELPGAFADLVCAAASSRRLVVAVEFLPENQPDLDAFLRADDADAARRILMAAPAWSDRVGRASIAIRDMLEQVRLLRVAGADISLVAFDHPSEAGPTSAAREAGMGRSLLEASRYHQGALVLALTGLGHADRTGWTSQVPPFQSAVQHLPTRRTLSLAFIRGGGETWACRSPAQGQPAECKAWPMDAREPIPPRGVVLDASREGFDGVVSAGMPYSASVPARDP